MIWSTGWGTLNLSCLILLDLFCLWIILDHPEGSSYPVSPLTIPNSLNAGSTDPITVTTLYRVLSAGSGNYHRAPGRLSNAN